MNKSRRMLALAAATIGVATTLAAPATAAPATAAPRDRGPEPASTYLGKVSAYGDTWVNIYWVAARKACDVKVRVRADDVSIYYPGDKRFTSPHRGDTLKPGAKDFTAVRVDPALTGSGIAKLKATISYTDCGRHPHATKRTFDLALPVVAKKVPRKH